MHVDVSDFTSFLHLPSSVFRVVGKEKKLYPEVRGFRVWKATFVKIFFRDV